MQLQLMDIYTLGVNRWRQKVDGNDGCENLQFKRNESV